jgi:glutamate-5-semialdehyde dehydrogenase
MNCYVAEMSTAEQLVEQLGRKAVAAAHGLAVCPTETKNKALLSMADALEKRVSEIISANAMDMEAGKKNGLSEAMLDRLKLNEKRVSSMARGLREVAALPDPVGEVIKEWTRPNGLRIRKIRVPLGVVGIIFESRPNVTADAASLCLKAGNACILRGGSEAIHSNTAIAKILNETAAGSGIPAHSIQMVEITDREVVKAMARADQYLACIVPRGGYGLIRAIQDGATVPVVKHLEGICHVYVDKDADLEMARRITINAKCQRPGVCNAMETLLVHRGVAEKFLTPLFKELDEKKVKIHGDEIVRKFGGKDVIAVTEKDYRTEWLDLVMSIHVVESLEEAIDHINTYGSHHSDSIVTANAKNAEKFLGGVDSATVYHNASTRFTDGGEFGLGAEIGISTDRLHARGPMALEELTTYKYQIFGDGQIRE